MDSEFEAVGEKLLDHLLELYVELVVAERFHLRVNRRVHLGFDLSLIHI